MPFFERADVLTQLDDLFRAASPPIACHVNATCDGEAHFWFLTAAKADVPNPIEFYARSISLTWEDATVFEDGAPFPGLSALTSDDLESPGFKEIREDILTGRFETAGADALKRFDRFSIQPAIHSILESFAPNGDLLVLRDEWNALSFLWETKTLWCFAEWSTSA
jgi:hypothetical protein